MAHLKRLVLHLWEALLSADKLHQKRKENPLKTFFFFFLQNGYKNHIKSEVDCDVKNDTGHSKLFSPRQ